MRASLPCRLYEKYHIIVPAQEKLFRSWYLSPGKGEGAMRAYLRTGVSLLIGLALMAMPFALIVTANGPIEAIPTGQLAFLIAMAAVVPLLFIRRRRWVRPVILLACVVAFGFLQLACVRPIGAIELIILQYRDIVAIALPLLKVGILCTVGVLFARSYCGWICPKGGVQEYVHQRRLSVTVPARVDRLLKYGKYVSLALLVGAPLLFEYRLFRVIEPFKVIFNLEGAWPIVLYLFAVLLVCIFVERAYCRYLCPLGGLLSLLARLSPWRIRFTAGECNACNLCARACPMAAINRSPSRTDTISLQQGECIVCGECIHACKFGAISYGWAHAPQLVEERVPPHIDADE
jgi:Fe-S-cluster-containing hydrogenase component 2